MSSFADISGSIQIDPPIPWREFADSEFYLPDARRAWRDLRFEVLESRENAPDGVFIRRTAVAIVAFDGETRGDDLRDELQMIAERHGTGRTFHGRLDVRWPDHEGSERRFKIVDGQAREYSPLVVWPPESD